MTIKKMFKFTLPAIMLATSVSAYAAGEVTLKNGEVKDWSAFVSAINDPTSIPGGTVDATVSQRWTQAQANYTAALQAAKDAPGKAKAATDRYNAANDSLSTLNEQLSHMSDAQKYTTTTAPWLANMLTDAQNFNKQYAQAYYSETVTGTTVYIWSKVESNLLYVSFIDPNDTSYVKRDAAQFYAWFTSTTSPLKFKATQIQLYLGAKYVDKDNALINNGFYEVTSYAKDDELIIGALVSSLQNLKAEGTYVETTETTAFTNLKNQIAAKKTWVAKLLQEKDDANDAVNTANSNVTTTKAEYDEAKAAYDQAVTASQNSALANYKEITLNADVTADVTINDFTKGKITGNGHIITLADGVAHLFGTLSNSNLINVAVQGDLAEAQNSAVLNRVAYWNGSTGEYFNAKGIEAAFTDLGKLGFAARADFGLNLLTGKFTPKDTYKVYDINVYQVSGDTQYYVNLTDDNKFVNGNYTTGIEIPVNTFVESATPDTEIADLDNIIINGSTCNNAVITDRVAFYCPKQLTAVKLTYDRQFNAGMNVACLPFAVTASDYDGIDYICEYDRETVDNFYFTSITDEVAANTPVLVYAGSNGFSFGQLSRVTLAATDKTQKVVGGNTDDSKSYGIFRQVKPGEIKGASQAAKVYGLLQSDLKFHPATDDAVFPALRMVIFSELARAESTVANAPRRIVILDEKGVEISGGWTTGIDGVEADNALSFDIAGGQGEIIFTSDADYGKVPVYSVDGKLITKANVVAGTTTVELQGGIYIVMGKKVLVK